jgi:outer membrane protein assembly factor BamB
MSRFIRSLASLTLTATLASAADWPCWRGPDSLGLSPERGLPSEWSREKNIAWKYAPPGRGASSPIVSGNRVYLTYQNADQELHVVALGREMGDVIWDREIGRGRLKAHDLINMAAPTPVTDGQSVWALFGTGDVACLDHEGKIVWQRNLVKEYGPYKTNHGYGSSPMLDSGRLFIACMHQGPSYVLALDAKTGSNLWKKDRNLGPTDESQDSYSSPLFIHEGDATRVVFAGAEQINAYDPKTGDEVWNFGGLKVPHPYGRTIAGATGAEGVVLVVASGFQNRGYTVAVKTGGRGNVTETHKLWTYTKYSADCPTPLIYEGRVFCIRDDGMASCIDLKTGEPHWQERLFTDNVKVSPVAADGKVYFTSGQANTVVTRSDSKLEVLSRNELNEPTLSTPAISGGRLYVRTDKALYCVGK